VAMHIFNKRLPLSQRSTMEHDCVAQCGTRSTVPRKNCSSVPPHY